MRPIKAGSTDQTIYVKIQNSSVTTGAGLTGLVYNTASLVAYYVKNQGTATQITLATLAAANSAHSDGGFKEVDATNMPGLYRLDLPDAAVDTAGGVVVMLKGATNMVETQIEIPVYAIDPYDSVRGGMTALPNAAAAASGGLFTRGTGAGQINQDANGRIDVNIVAISEDATAAANAEAFFDGTGYAGTNNVIPTVTNLTNLPSIPANWLTAAGTAADFTTEIQAGLATAADLATVAGYIDTEVAAIKAKTDQLTFTVANTVNSNVTYVNDVEVVGTGTLGDEWGPA